MGVETICKNLGKHSSVLSFLISVRKDFWGEMEQVIEGFRVTLNLWLYPAHISFVEKGWDRGDYSPSSLFLPFVVSVKMMRWRREVSPRGAKVFWEFMELIYFPRERKRPHNISCTWLQLNKMGVKKKEVEIGIMGFASH
jgi:hypothetical protein